MSSHINIIESAISLRNTAFIIKTDFNPTILSFTSSILNIFPWEQNYSILRISLETQNNFALKGQYNFIDN